MADKVDFKKIFKTLYGPRGNDFSVVDVPPMRFLMCDGHGDPNTSPDYATAVQALYSIAYPLKFASKRQLDRDYVVPPLEGLWWADDPSVFRSDDRAEWQWTMMIMVPDWIPADLLLAAMGKVDGAGGRVREEVYAEGTCIQIMHTGPYSAEAETLRRLHNEYMPSNGWTFNGKHHEIYIGDPRKAEPSKLKTVLRQPVKAS